jgi:glycosyltransferase involved in cell wall biosynthesis
MKIVILTQYYQPEMGAPQSRLYELATGLQKLGWEVSVVTAMPNYPTGKIFKEYKGHFSVIEVAAGIKIKRLWLYASNSSSTFPRIVSMLSFSFTALFATFFIRRQKADFLLVESPPLTVAFSGWLLSKLAGCRLLLNVSDLWPLSAKELGAISDGTAYRMLEKLEKFLYRKAEVSIGQSQEIVDHIANKGGANVYLFRNGVDIHRFKVAVKKENAGTPRLIYAGLLGVAQGVLAICRGIDFKALGVEFHVYGNGAERQELETFLAEHPGKNIILHQPVGRNEIPALLQGFDGTIIPLVRNIYGAVPSKIYEAMAAGLPVLFSGEGEGAAIITKYEVGLVSPAGEMEMLKQNIAKLMTNEAMQFSFSENGKRAAADVFDRNVQIRDLSAFLQQLSRKK